MRLNAIFVIALSILVSVCQVQPSTANEFETNALEQPIAGNAIALMLAKLDYLQSKLLEMDLGLKERDEELAEKMLNLETQFIWAGHNLTALQDQSRKILAQQAACASHEQMRKEIFQLNSVKLAPSTIGQLLATSPYLQGSKQKRSLQSCKKAPANKSGVYSIQVDEEEDAFDAFCEQNSFGGGWLVIQYRFDGLLDFYRNWTEYRNGFGDINREYWIGLEKIHQLTSRQRNELMVEIKDFDGAYSYAHYKHFEIGNEIEQYRLKELGAYDGNAGDALEYNRGMKFSTIDKEISATNCAKVKEAGWWHNYCTSANLNGRYLNEGVTKAISWSASAYSYHGLAYTRMMIREI